jgi:hypothetical protein
LTTTSIPAETATSNKGGTIEKFSYRVLTIGLFVWSGFLLTVQVADPPQTAQPPNTAVLSALAQYLPPELQPSTTRPSNT